MTGSYLVGTRVYRLRIGDLTFDENDQPQGRVVKVVSAGDGFDIEDQQRLIVKLDSGITLNLSGRDEIVIAQTA